MDQCQGYPSPGSPMATGTGIGSGSGDASTGSQRCSLDTCAAYDCALGSRTNKSGPRRNVRLSQPFGSAAVMGRLDHCGNCDPTSRATSWLSISTGLVLPNGQPGSGRHRAGNFTLDT